MDSFTLIFTGQLAFASREVARPNGFSTQLTKWRPDPIKMREFLFLSRTYKANSVAYSTQNCPES